MARKCYDFNAALEKAWQVFATLPSGERHRKVFHIVSLCINLGWPAEKCVAELTERYWALLREKGDPKKRTRERLEEEIRLDVNRIYKKAAAGALASAEEANGRTATREQRFIAAATDLQWRKLVNELVEAAPQEDGGSRNMGDEQEWLEEREAWIRKVAGDVAPGECYFVGGNGDANDPSHFFGAGDPVPLRVAKFDPTKTERENAELELRYGGDRMCPNPLVEKRRCVGSVARCRYLLLETDMDFYGFAGKLGPSQFGDYQQAWQVPYFRKLKELGVPIASLVFSGGKSVHALAKVEGSVEEFEAAKDGLKLEYAYLRLDPSNLELSRTTRVAFGWRERIDSEGKIPETGLLMQEPLLEDFGCAALSPAAFLAKLQEIHKAFFPQKFHWPVKKVEAANGGERWVAMPENLPTFTKECGFIAFKKGNDPDEKRKLYWRRGRYYLEVSTEDALAMMCAEIGARLSLEHAGRLVHSFEDRLGGRKLGFYYASNQRLNPLVDDRGFCRIPYANGVVEIDRKGVRLRQNHPWDIPGDSPSVLRDYDPDAPLGGEFEQFVERACGSLENHPEWGARKDSIMSLLGYLLCRHHEPVNYLCVLTEETKSENDGGTGKSMIMKAVKYVRRRYLMDCKMVDERDSKRFYLSGIERGTDYIQFDDVQKDLDYKRFYTMASDDWMIELKGVNKRIHIDAAEAPKMCFATNYFPKGMGESLWRRVRLFELSNHYNARTTPLGEFGHRLFDDWDAEEWRRFDRFLAECVLRYQRGGLAECNSTNIVEKKLEANIREELVEFFDELAQSHAGETIKKCALPGMYAEWHNATRGTYGKEEDARTLLALLRAYCKIKKTPLKDSAKFIDGKTFKCIVIGEERQAVVVDCADKARIQALLHRPKRESTLERIARWRQSNAAAAATPENAAPPPLADDIPQTPSDLYRQMSPRMSSAPPF